MPFWTAALKAIPWATILVNAPGMMKTAEQLLSGAQTRPRSLASSDEFVDLADRVTELERYSQAHSELFVRMTAQIDALTTTVDALAARVRLLLVSTLVLAALLILALVLIVVRT